MRSIYVGHAGPPLALYRVIGVVAAALCTSGCHQGAPGEAPPDAGMVDPGRITIHRLNRVEYNNTVHDLLDTALRPADDFPSDDRGYGFDNIADVLSLSPLQVELYNHAAEALAAEAMAIPITVPSVFHFEAQQVKSMVGAPYGNDAWNLYSNGDLTATATLPLDGLYSITVKAAGQQAGPEVVKMSINVDGIAVKLVDVPAVEAMPGMYVVQLMIKKGIHTVGVSFLNDYYNPMLNEDRNLLVYWWEVKGPLDLVAKTNPIRERIMTCDPAVKGQDPCAREILGNFGRRAFRRPLTDDEISRLAAFVPQAVAAGDDFDMGIRLALEAILTSPHFIFRVEIDADPASLMPHPIGDYELASRLSYFLWSSMPDDVLYAAAAAGTLNSDAAIAAQVARMLADPRADALVQNFAGQWLYTRAVDDHAPDPAAYPSWDNDLKEAMRSESQTFFRDLLFKDAPIDDLLTGNYTYVNARLAKHYGLTFDPSQGQTQRVSLAATARRGILGQGSVLMSTSYPLRTSPVKRGKWVLEQLLCSGPPAPPPNVPGLNTPAMPTGTLRQRLEEHRKDPKCAVCHTQMDPIGFAMENFDGIGAYRTTDSGFPIDATGDLPPLGHFSNAAELSALVQKDPRFGMCVAQQLFTYALGRPPGNADGEHLQSMADSWKRRGGHLKDFITLLAQSDPFRKRHGETPSASKGGMP